MFVVQRWLLYLFDKKGAEVAIFLKKVTSYCLTYHFKQRVTYIVYFLYFCLRLVFVETFSNDISRSEVNCILFSQNDSVYIIVRRTNIS